MNKERPTLLEFEMRIKAIDALKSIESALQWHENAHLRDAYVYIECKHAYREMQDIVESLENAKWNRDIKHEPCEKQNITKGF